MIDMEKREEEQSTKSREQNELLSKTKSIYHNCLSGRSL